MHISPVLRPRYVCMRQADVFFITRGERFTEWHFYMSACWMGILQGHRAQERKQAGNARTGCCPCVGDTPMDRPRMDVSKPCSNRAAAALGSCQRFLGPVVSNGNANCLFELPNLNVVYQI